MEIPTFGAKKRTVTYKKRVGAYIIVAKDHAQKIVLVQAPNGAYFLPGGEIEKGETKEMAINREMLEELGFKVAIDAYLGQADEYYHSRHRQTNYYNPGHFFVASSWEKVGAPLEETNTICWTTVDRGIGLLKRGSHKWAVKQWQLASKN